MSKTAKFFTGVGIVTSLMILFKIYLIFSGDYYLLEAWLENIIIHIGIAILLGGTVEFLSKKKRLKNFKTLVIEISTILIGVCSYNLQAGWLYIVNLHWVKEACK